MNTKALLDISMDMIKRYSDRYNNLGYNIRTLGWGTVEQQKYRFEQTLFLHIPYKNNIVLDIGCGFGDYYKFLVERNVMIKQYIGWDINKDLINEARQRYDDKKVKFDIVDLTTECENEIVADIGVMLGVLNLNFKEKMNNYEYSKLIINNAFNKVSKVLIVDFLSTQFTPDYPKEDFVFYHSPAEVMKIALDITPNVVLNHSYLPIPQKEFMLFLYK